MNYHTYLSQPLIGGRLSCVLRFVSAHGFPKKGLHWLRLAYVLLATTLLIPGFAWLERRLYNKIITATKLPEDPVLIIGHWRSGTTFLHSLMAAGEWFGVLNNRQAFLPNTMLTGGRFMRWLASFHLLPKRPMDDVSLSSESEQEEEFALINLFGTGAYAAWYFPRSLRFFFERYCLLEGMSDPEKKSFFEQYQWLVKKISFVNGAKPLLLKNPANTGRVKELLQIFPKARFIYLYRDPCEVYYSTLRLHEKLAEQFGLQEINRSELCCFVPDFYKKLLQKFERDKRDIPPRQLVEVAYEDLLARPLNVLESIYRQLNLPGFNACMPAFRQFLIRQKTYRPARYDVSEGELATIQRLMRPCDTSVLTGHAVADGHNTYRK